MKKKLNLLTCAALVIVAVTCLIGCKKRDSIIVSTQDLWFGLEAETLELVITSNCNWTIYKNEEADWYTISKMEGSKDDTLYISVTDLTDADFRGASFVIISPGAHVRRTVFVSQNKLDFDGMVNKVFGVTVLEHWITDYFDQIIEDEYHLWEYDPYDTARGYLMYFLEDGKGYQRDHHSDTVAWWAFDYEFDIINQKLYINFATIDGAPESYAPDVLTASDSLYRFFHEYKPHYFERADMRKIATYHGEGKAEMQRKAKKRKAPGPVFLTE